SVAVQQRRSDRTRNALGTKRADPVRSRRLGAGRRARCGLWIGLNDLAGAGAFYPAAEQASVDDIIAGLRQLVGRAHEYGLTILGCTIFPMGGNTSLPGFDTPAHEAARVALNQCMRTSGVFDGVVSAE